MQGGNILLRFPYCVHVCIILYHVVCITWSFPARDFHNGAYSQQLSIAVPQPPQVVSLAVSEVPALLKAL